MRLIPNGKGEWAVFLVGMLVGGFVVATLLNLLGSPSQPDWLKIKESEWNAKKTP